MLYKEIYKQIKILIILVILLMSCGAPDDPNYLGYVEYLAKGEYIIYNYGSRHMVKCIRPDGKYYMLNDSDFEQNGIQGYDAHQYREKTKIIIK